MLLSNTYWGENEKYKQKVKLRKISEQDLQTILTWRNSDRVRANMFTDHIITMEEHRRWYDSVKKNDNSVYLIFEYNEKPYGLTNFTDINNLTKTCSWGFYLGNGSYHSGLGTILAYLSIDYAILSLQMEKIYGRVLAFNTASIGLFLKMGFTKDVVLTNYIFKNGAFEDVIIFVLLKDEWLKKQRIR